jgi:hypothetical protein
MLVRREDNGDCWLDCQYNFMSKTGVQTKIKIHNFSIVTLLLFITMTCRGSLYVIYNLLASWLLLFYVYCCICCSCCIVSVFTVVVNRICFVLIVVGCPLLLCFVYCVLIKCVVTSCNVCYLSVVSLLYYCHRAKTQLQSNNK